MKMYPIKDYRHTEHIYDSEFRYVKFSIGNPYHKNLFIGFESPNIIEIYSNNMIRDGYYKIIGEEIDFIYLSNTLKENKYWSSGK